MKKHIHYTIKDFVNENYSNNPLFTPEYYLDDLYSDNFMKVIYKEDEILTQIKKEINFIKNIKFPLKVYRGVGNVKEYSDNQGDSWTTDFSVAGFFGDKIFVGLVKNIESIDIEKTIIARVKNPRENEINIPNFDSIDIIETINGDEVIGDLKENAEIKDYNDNYLDAFEDEISEQEYNNYLYGKYNDRLTVEEVIKLNLFFGIYRISRLFYPFNLNFGGFGTLKINFNGDVQKRKGHGDENYYLISGAIKTQSDFNDINDINKRIVYFKFDDLKEVMAFFKKTKSSFNELL